jgi:hypothetical protein
VRELLAILLYSAFMLVMGLAVVTATEARDSEVPVIIEKEMPHAWCYVLQNRQNKLVGNIHIMSCVPKGDPSRASDYYEYLNKGGLSIEESDSD